MDKLQNILLKVPEWHDDWQVLPFLTCYEGHAQEQWQLDFWQRVIEKVAFAEDIDFTLTAETLGQYLARNSRQVDFTFLAPDLMKRGVLLSYDAIKQAAQAKRSTKVSWKSWIGNKAKAWLKTEDNRFVIRKTVDYMVHELKRLMEQTGANLLWEEKQVTDMLTMMFKLPSEEIALVIEYMYAFSQIEIQPVQDSSGKKNFIDTSKASRSLFDALQVAIDNLQRVQAQIQEIIVNFHSNKELIHSKFADALASAELDAARELFKREKRLESHIETLLALDDAIKTQVTELGKSQTPEMVIIALKSRNPHITPEEAINENQEAVEQQLKNSATIAEVWSHDEMLESEFVKEYSELFKAAAAE